MPSQLTCIQPHHHSIHPSILMIIKMLLVIPFGVSASTLVLYLTHNHISDSTAISMTACFLGSAGILRITAGYIADRYIRHHYLLLLSALFMLAGCLLLSHPAYAQHGMCAIAIGSAFTIAINCIITNLYLENDSQREMNFLLNYSVMNIGFLVSFLISGYFELTQRYDLLFMTASFFSVAALSLILFNWRELNILKSHIVIRNIVNGIVLIFCMYGLMYVVLRWATNFESTYQTGINISAFILILYGIKKLYQKKDNTVLTCLLFIIPAVLFSTLHYLSPLIITLFLKRNIDAHIYGFLISPQWFQLAGTLAIVIGGPIVIFVFNFLRKRQITINTSLQFSLALILMGLSFVMMSYGIKHFTNGFSININWLIAGNLIQGIAELLLAPIGFSMIARIAPTCSRGTMMGVWLLLLSLGAIFSGYLSNSITDIKYAFSILAIVPILCGSIIFLLRYKLTE